MRTFIAVEVPEKIRREIDSFIKEQAKQNVPIKWVKFDNLHITLQFLGEIDESKKKETAAVIAEIARKFTRLQVKLEGIGCFPSPRNPRVLWIGVKEGAEKLCEIAQSLETALSRSGFKEEKRFHPHLTIGRIKTSCKVDNILEKNIETEPFQVNSITLFKSTLKPEGPIYEELENFPLV